MYYMCMCVLVHDFVYIILFMLCVHVLVLCMYQLYHTECGIINIYHVADLSQPFLSSFTAMKERSPAPFTWCLLLYKR